ncbi:LRR receptor-like serine/threonine-protein kinase GHR1 [Linum grandiflorum]
MANNSITGQIPDNIGDFKTLEFLDLSNNLFNSSLPSGIGKLGSLRNLSLAGNNFSGPVPDSISGLASLQSLDLSKNSLSGAVPASLTRMDSLLNHLNLSYNSLTGSLPRSITQYPKMTVLDLSSNQFEGPLLSDLLTSPTLQELRLGHNSLSGDIEFVAPPNSKSDLQVLDLSHNRLNGYFPDRFGLLAGLHELNLAGNNISGSLPTSMAGMSSLTSLDLSQNHFTGPIPSNLSSSLESFNVSNNDLSGVVPENLRTFPTSSFYPGNAKLILPGGNSSNVDDHITRRKPINTAVKIVVIVSCVIAVLILILLAIFIHYLRLSSRSSSEQVASKAMTISRPVSKISGGVSGTGRGAGGGALVVSAEELVAAHKGSSSEILSPDEKLAAVTGGFSSPSKQSRYSWSPESGGESLARLDVRSPDRLVGELHFLDDTISLTPEELSRAPAEVLGRSSHGTSYRATLDNGVFLTVKWLREGVAKPKKDFAKEARKFTNIRHPNVVGLRGYYWGPTQHEKLILSDYISPGSLASFLFGKVSETIHPSSFLSFKYMLLMNNIKTNLNGLPTTRVIGMQWF